MPTNKLSVEVSEKKIARVHRLLDRVLEELDFLIDLPVEERIGMPKMGRGHADMVQNTLSFGEVHPHLQPRVWPVEEIKKDVVLARLMRGLESKLDVVSQKVKDTAMQAEAEAYQGSRLYYSSAKGAADAGDPEAERIVKELSLHYKRRKSSKKQESSLEESKK
ncbi:MAG: hypothetical protein GY940_06680 [bacterium]|nr:hypothetical protein [bacterium]